MSQPTTIVRPRDLITPSVELPRLTEKQRRLNLYNRDRVFFGRPGGLSPVELFLLTGGAGSYANVPSRRMAYDADDSVVAGLHSDTTAQSDGVPVPEAYTEHTVGNVQAMNDEEVASVLSGSANTTLIWGILFPELREIDGYFWNWTTNDLAQDWLYESADTTNLRDGSWSAVGSQVRNTSTTLEAYRTSITSAALSSRRAIVAHLRHAGGVGDTLISYRFHVYGEISSGETPDRLLWVDNGTGSEFGLPIDYGDVPRGSAREYEVKLRNNSSSLQANSVQVTAEDLYGGSGSWYTFKEAGGSFSSTLSLASAISSSSDSPVITIRQNIPDSAVAQLHAARAYVSVGSWS